MCIFVSILVKKKTFVNKTVLFSNPFVIHCYDVIHTHYLAELHGIAWLQNGKNSKHRLSKLKYHKNTHTKTAGNQIKTENTL